jgi:hypothetical protein
VFFNVALVGVANSRLVGGTWTFRDGLELAWARKGTILQWALVAATVGIILKSLEERLGVLGRIVMRIIGVAWALANYFVVPVLAFEDLTPIEAIKRSSKLFKETWGEKVVGGFSFSLVFFVLALPGIGLAIAAAVLGGVNGCSSAYADVPVLPAALGDQLGGTGHLQRGAVPLRLLQAGSPGLLGRANHPGLGSKELKTNRLAAGGRQFRPRDHAALTALATSSAPWTRAQNHSWQFVSCRAVAAGKNLSTRCNARGILRVSNPLVGVLASFL